MNANNRWLIAITVTLATFMELLDTSIANVSLPHIAGGLGNTYDETTWVLTSYLVANAVVLPLSAWLSRVFGRKNYYLACVALFTFSSLLCGLAPNLELLILFRIFQGLGGGGLAPVEQAILVDTFPIEQRASAFGLYSMAIVTAPAIGPPLGGWITDNFSWHWVFLINIPIGLLSLFLSYKLVKDPPAFVEEVKAAKASGKLKIDWLGIILVVIGFGCLEVVLDRGQREDWLQSPFIASMLIVALIAIIGGIIWELRHTDPVVEIRLLAERNFALASIFYFILGFVLFGSTVLIPQLLQSLFGYSATDAGLVLGPGALVIVVLAPFMVKFVPKIGPQILIIIGYLFLGAAMWHFSHLDLSADYGYFAWARAFQGVGLGFLFVPVSQVAYSFLPKDKNNKASSLTNLFRNLGGSFGIATMTTQLEQRSQLHRSQLVEHLSVGSAHVTAALHHYSVGLMHRGFPFVQASKGAMALLNKTLTQQASLLAFMDCFWILGAIAFFGFFMALFIKRGKLAAVPEGAH